MKKKDLRTPRKFEFKTCSRCGVAIFTKKERRIHFRQAHGFKCMKEAA